MNKKNRLIAELMGIAAIAAIWSMPVLAKPPPMPSGVPEPGTVALLLLGLGSLRLVAKRFRSKD